MLLLSELLQFDHISAGNKIPELNTELSMATICIFIVAMVTILLAFHLPSSSPQTPCRSSSSSAPSKIRRQKVGDSLEEIQALVINDKMPLFANFQVSKFERKGYNKVTTISLKKHNSIKSILLNKITKSNYMFSRKFEKA